jgi:hypothetical protein
MNSVGVHCAYIIPLILKHLLVVSTTVIIVHGGNTSVLQIGAVTCLRFHSSEDLGLQGQGPNS